MAIPFLARSDGMRTGDNVRTFRSLVNQDEKKGFMRALLQQYSADTIRNAFSVQERSMVNEIIGLVQGSSDEVQESSGEVYMGGRRRRSRRCKSRRRRTRR